MAPASRINSKVAVESAGDLKSSKSNSRKRSAHRDGGAASNDRETARASQSHKKQKVSISTPTDAMIASEASFIAAIDAYDVPADYATKINKACLLNLSAKAVLWPIRGDVSNGTPLAKWTDEDVTDIIKVIFEGVQGDHAEHRWPGTSRPSTLPRMFENVKSQVSLDRDSLRNRRARGEKVADDKDSHQQKSRKASKLQDVCPAEDVGSVVRLSLRVKDDGKVDFQIRCERNHKLCKQDLRISKQADGDDCRSELLETYIQRTASHADHENQRQLLFHLRKQVYWDMTATERGKMQMRVAHHEKFVPNNDLATIRSEMMERLIAQA